MLAYVFWHRPRPEADLHEYERALIAFHSSLARSKPAGLERSASFRTPELPWLAVAAATDTVDAGGYEDWYLLDGYSSLGVLNEAAVGHGHRSAHDRAAHHTALGTAGLYALQDGDTAAWEQSTVTVWVRREAGSAAPALGDLLADGLDPGPACLWRRQMSFGPAPEFCLHTSHAPAGVAEGRLPQGWSARTLERERLPDG